MCQKLGLVSATFPLNLCHLTDMSLSDISSDEEAFTDEDVGADKGGERS